MAQTEEVLFAQQIEEDTYNEQPPEIQTEKYLIFSSDGLMYGIKTEQVKDIITEYSITRLPRVPSYVKGVINLRGQIVPIVDIRLRLGKPEKDTSCGITVEVDGNMVGIQVDMVEQIVDIPVDSLLPIPTNNGSSQALVSGMCTLPDGNTMLELDCEQLLHE